MSKRIVIVGGGVIGLCVAYYCAKRGHRVTVLDRESNKGDGCSSGNAGMIVPSHFVPLAAPGMVWLGFKWMWNPESPFYIRPRLNLDLIRWGMRFCTAATATRVKNAAPVLRDLNLVSRELYCQLADSGVEFGLERRGLLMLCKTQHAMDEEAVAAKKANELGVPAQVLDARQTAELDPAVTMDISGAVYFPKDCHLQPDRFLNALESSIKANGGTILRPVHVLGFRKQADRIQAVTTADGEIEGDEFVLCGGAWSTEVAQSLSLAIPMQAGKGYSLTVPNPIELPKICSIFTEARVAVTPMGNSLRFGGTMEISGLNLEINQARVQGIIKSVPKYYPKFSTSHFEGIQPWRGLRPCSPDGMPYIGRTNRYNNLVIGTGHAMMGLSLAPITGTLIAQIIDGQKSSIDLRLLGPDRYA
jgi:D-amino-acid dehydrogenase